MNTVERLQQQAHALDLLDTDEEVQDWFHRMTTQEGSVQRYYCKKLQDRIDATIKNRLTLPFVTAPPIIGDGDILLGYQHDGSPVSVYLHGEVNRHTTITGAAGSGKSNTGLAIVVQARQLGAHVWGFNPKGDLDCITVRDDDFLRIHPNIAYNTMLPCPGMTMPEHQYLWRQSFASTSWGGENTKIVLADAQRKTYAANDTPSPADLHLNLKGLYKRSDGTRFETSLLVAQKLERFRDLYPGMFFCRQGIPTTTLLNHSLDIPAALVSEPDQFLATLLPNQLFHYKKDHGPRDCTTHVIVIEEGFHLLAGAANRVDPHPPLASVWMTGRERGLAFVCIAISPSLLSTTITSSAYTQLAMPMTDARDAALIARAFGLSNATQTYVARKLATGQAVACLGGRYRHPVLLTIPRLTVDKHVTTEQLQAVIQRTDDHNPHKPQPATIIAALPEPQEPATDSIALNATEKAIVHVLEQGPLLTSETYERAGRLHPVVGDRARKKLEKPYGFLISGKVPTGKGRGKTGIALNLTPKAWEWLGKKPPHGLRGGSSLQHVYWCSTIARALGATLETQIGTKSVDIALNYQAATHERFLQYLLDTAHRLTDTITTIADGDIIAIEVESDSPDKTALNNAGKDAAAGIPLTIIAVHRTLLQTHAQLKEHLDADLWSKVLLVDVLWLLDTCRSLKVL